MELNFQRFGPIPPLAGYIKKIWAFESSAPMPQDDMKLVVPNGRLLLIVSFRNGLTGKMDGRHYLAKTNQIALVGMSDCPAIVDAAIDGPTGSIGVEISPMGAYRFFHFKLKDIKKQLCLLTDILDRTGREFEQGLAEAVRIDQKVQMLQHFLLSLFRRQEEDQLFEHCVRQLAEAGGSLQVKQLEKLTGYSTRWLHMKFEERLGISPKNLGSILRFQRYYQALLSDSADFLRQKEFYRHYHDESHFIREFRRFTGMPPLKLLAAKNDFGSTFYQG